MGRKPTEWREFDSDATMPPGPHKKLRLYVDLSVPRIVVEELRSHGVVLHLASQKGASNRPDPSIYQEARQLGLVLLTMDRDFWRDSEHPLETTAGIVFLDVSPGDTAKASRAFVLFYLLFAKHYPLDRWKRMKARIYENGFVLRMRTWEGRITEDEFQLDDSGKVITRTLR